MRTKLALFIAVTILSSSFKCFASDKFSYGFKTGPNWGKITSLEMSRNILDSPENSSLLGFSFGGFLEHNLSSQFSFLYELSYQLHKANVKVLTLGNEVLFDHELIAQNIMASVIMKYRLGWLYNTYCVIGPNLSYLITAEDRVSHFGHLYEVLQIADDLPTFSTSADLGLGRKFKILSFETILELRAQFGFTRYKFDEIGKWNNAGLKLLLGMQF